MFAVHKTHSQGVQSQSQYSGFYSIFAAVMKEPFTKLYMYQTVALTLLLFFSLFAKGQVNYEHFLHAGQIDLQKEDYLSAVKNFNTAIYSKADGFEAYFLRGIAKFSLGDFQGAKNDFSETIRMHPLYVRAYHYRGISLDRMYDFPHAINDFDKALEIDPFNPQVFMARGDTKLHLHDYYGAIADYSSAIELDADIERAWLNRGISHHLLGENEAALKDVDEAIFLDYFNPETWAKRAMIKYEIDSLQSALDDFNHSISIDDDNPFVYFQRGLTFLKMSDTLAALEDYDKVIEMEPDNALTYYNRALVKSMQKDYDGALRDYNVVVEINPMNIYGRFNRGILFFEMENWDAAEQDFTTAIEIFPDFVGAWINRSAVRERNHNRKGARQDQERAKEIIAIKNADDKSPEALYQRYQDSVYFSEVIEFEADFVSGNIKKGRVQFQRVSIKPKPNFLLIHTFPLVDSIAEEYRKSEYFDKNISQFNANSKLDIRFAFSTSEWPVTTQQAVEKLNYIDSAVLVVGRDTAGAFFMKGMINGMLQNYNEAIHAYDAAIEKDPEISYAYLNRGTTSFELGELVFSEQQYSSSISISRSTFGNQQPIVKPPDHKGTLKDYNKVISMNPELPFVYYNRANVKLSLQQFQRAIDDYSQAIKLDPELAEAYYNRALTLLFLKENKLACKDLSKAGELGISEAYNVIKRYCNK